MELTAQQALQIAIDHHQNGRLHEAEKLYRQILGAQPDHPYANHNLGLLAIRVGQPVSALPFLTTALEARPNEAVFWLSLIDGLSLAGQSERARQLIDKARRSGMDVYTISKLESRLDHHLSTEGNDTKKEIPDVLQVAIALRESGAYEEALLSLRNWLQQNPGDATAHALTAHVLLLDNQVEAAETALCYARNLAPGEYLVKLNSARLLLKRKQFEAALKAAQNVFEENPKDPETWVVFASALIANNRDSEALPIIDSVLQIRPEFAEALASRALLKLRAKDPLGALADAQQALKLKSHLAQIWALAARANYQLDNFASAIEALEKALELQPDNISFMVDLGEFLRQSYRSDEAIRILNRAVHSAPEDHAAWTNLGATLHGVGHLEKARVAYETALRLNPAQPEVAHNLGVLAERTGSLSNALSYYEQALSIQPHNLHFLASKGSVLLELSRPPNEIEDIVRTMFSIQPNHELALRLLGALCEKLGRIDEAVNCFRKAVAASPNSAGANAALGRILRDQLELEAAEFYLLRAKELDTKNLDIHSTLLFTKNYLVRHTASDRLREAKRFGEIASEKVYEKIYFKFNNYLPERLNVGIVSGDLRSHPVGYFLESFIPFINQNRVNILAYPTQPKSDKLTERLRPYFKSWQPIHHSSDAAAAKLISEDQIHILLDLSGHTKHNRLALFAWTPAPVQASWLGYFATTGLEQMDFLLCDPYVSPLGEETHFVEKIWRMPQCYLCFSPPTTPSAVTPLPALSAGRVTYGCFNNLAKLNESVIELWSRVLDAVPGSRLLIKTKQLAYNENQNKILARFSAYGIEPDRLMLEGPSKRAELLMSYNKVDIALDPFPYPGGTTSAEALWMGVPVLTRRGDCFLSHVGETIAINAGMADWIASDADDYVAKAAAFSSDLERLSALRAGLRQNLQNTPLFDGRRFAQHFEDAMWGMWQSKMDVQNRK